MSYSSIKKNLAYKITLTVSMYLMSVLTFPYVSRVLGVEQIGLVNFIDNTVNYFMLFATMGVTLLGVREIAAVKDNKEECGRVFSKILGLNILFTIIVLVIYLLLIGSIPKLNQYSELFFIGASKIIFSIFLIEWFFTGIEKFSYITITSIITKFLYVISIFLYINSPKDYRLYFILTVSLVCFNALMNFIYANKIVKVSIIEMFRIKYIRQNLLLGTYSLMTSMYLTFNVILLGLFTTNVQVGYYTTAFKLYSIILGFFTAFTNVMLPRMSILLEKGEKEQFKQLIDRSFAAVFTFSIPLIIISVVLAPQIIDILSGSGYEGSVLPMRIIMPAVLFVGIAQVLAIQILMPMKKDKILLVASAAGAIISLIINFTIVPSLGCIGSAFVLLCAEMSITIIYIIYAIKHKMIDIPVHIILKKVIYAIPVLLICLISSYIFTNTLLILLVSMFLLTIYYLFLYISGIPVFKF